MALYRPHKFLPRLKQRWLALKCLMAGQHSFGEPVDRSGLYKAAWLMGFDTYVSTCSVCQVEDHDQRHWTGKKH